VLELDLVHTLVFARVALLRGHRLRRLIPILERYNLLSRPKKKIRRTMRRISLLAHDSGLLRQRQQHCPGILSRTRQLMGCHAVFGYPEGYFFAGTQIREFRVLPLILIFWSGSGFKLNVSSESPFVFIKVTIVTSGPVMYTLASNFA